MYRISRITLLITVFVIGWITAFTQSQTTDEVKQKQEEFNFWLCQWNVYKSGTDTLAGTSHNESILGGRAIRENYKAASSGYQGASLNKYNARTGLWEQFWVDNSGLTLHIQGNFDQDRMILQNEENSVTGLTRNKLTWIANPDKTVRQIWEQSYSADGPWLVIFDGHYRPEMNKPLFNKS